jgi:putative MATE family efflux protein
MSVIGEAQFRDTVDLAWPRIVTGFAIMSKRTVDLAIVGVAVGAEAVAGLGVANGFWTVGKFAYIGLSGGTLALVSQNYGGEEAGRAADAVAASILIAAVTAIPVAAVFALGARPLVSLVGGGPATTGFGAAYLAVVAPGLVFEAFNLVASRTYAGVGDTVTPMAVRAAGAVLNVTLSATLVFGAGWGVVGAGVGTTLATAIVALVFAWGMTGRSYAGRGASPIPVGPDSRPTSGLVRQLLRVTVPLVARRIAQGVVVFPLLAIAAAFGPAALAALSVARQIRQLLGSFTWGFSIAASTLVGQALGGAEEARAVVYGRDIAKLSLLVYVLAAAVVVAVARPVATLFVDSAVSLTALFVASAAVSAVPLGVDGSLTGALRGAGDTRVPFLATLAGLYLVALPVAYLGTVTAVGVTALLVALVAETTVPVVVNLRRFRSRTWLAVSRDYRPETDADIGD